jgi:hypothetical protein
MTVGCFLLDAEYAPLQKSRKLGIAELVDMREAERGPKFAQGGMRRGVKESGALCQAKECRRSGVQVQNVDFEVRWDKPDEVGRPDGFYKIPFLQANPLGGRGGNGRKVGWNGGAADWRGGVLARPLETDGACNDSFSSLSQATLFKRVVSIPFASNQRRWLCDPCLFPLLTR